MSIALNTSDTTKQPTNDMSSSGCMILEFPELPSGFLTVGAAVMVALADTVWLFGIAAETEVAPVVEYAGNVGFTGPMGVLLVFAEDVGLKSGPTGAELVWTEVCKDIG